LEVEGARVLFEALPRFEKLATVDSAMPLSVGEEEEDERDVDAHPVGALVPIIAAAIPKLKALREFYVADLKWGISLDAFLMLMHAFEGHEMINRITFARANPKRLERESVDEMLRVYAKCPRLRYIFVDYESEVLKTSAETEIERLWEVKKRAFKDARAKRAKTETVPDDGAAACGDCFCRRCGRSVQ